MNKEGLQYLATELAQVVGPTKVEVFGPMFGNFKQRETFVVADCEAVLPKTIFGSFMDQENFVIMLASAFVGMDALARLTVGGQPVPHGVGVGDLEYCAEVATSLMDTDSAKYEDDGGAWRLEAMRNIQTELEFRLSEAEVENVTVIA